MADSNTLQLTLQVKDDGSIVIDQVAGKIKGMGDTTESAASKSSSTLGGLKESWLAVVAGATAGYFAIKKSIDTLNSFVTAAAEAQQIESRMAFQIQQTGIQYDKVKMSIDAYALSVLKSTRFSDEAAREGLGKMMMYTNDLTDAIKNTKLAMDISTQTGMDLDSVIRLLGMAMGGEIEVWNRWSLQIRNANSVLGENAGASEKAAFALRELNQLYGGAAQNDAKTYAGSIAQMNNEWKKTKELLGEKLMPYFQMWNEGVRTLANDIFPSEEEALKRIIEKEKDLIENYSLLALEQPQVAEQVEKATERMVAAERKLSEIRAKLKTDTDDAIKAEQDRANAAKRGYEEITKYASVLDEANHAYKMLGITSTSVTDEQVSKAQWAVEKIKKAWQEGKATALDYYNALKTAAELQKKIMGDSAEQTQKLFDLSEDYEKKIKEISWDDPDRRKKIQAMTDDWITARGKILDAYKTPVEMIADIAPMETDFEKGKQEYLKFKSYIEGKPIKINYENLLPAGGGGAGGGGEGYSSLSPSPEETGRPTWGSDTEANVNFTATGMSPKISLGDAFKKIMANFSTMEEKSSAMEATINFAELSLSLKTLQKSYDAQQASIDQWVATLRKFDETADWQENIFIKRAQANQKEIADQMNLIKLKEYYEAFKAGIPGAEKQYYDFFKKYYGTLPSYQQGISYVPKTGFALVHQGEKITPANQNFSMGGMVVNFHFHGDPKGNAEEMARVLEYNLSGRLKDAIRKIGGR